MAIGGIPPKRLNKAALGLLRGSWPLPRTPGEKRIPLPLAELRSWGLIVPSRDRWFLTRQGELRRSRVLAYRRTRASRARLIA